MDTRRLWQQFMSEVLTCWNGQLVVKSMVAVGGLIAWVVSITCSRMGYTQEHLAPVCRPSAPSLMP
jgi:hypothetical protein